MGWRRDRRVVEMALRERNEMASECSAAKVALSLIASEVNIILRQGAVRLPVVEKHLDDYYRKTGGPGWRERR